MDERPLSGGAMLRPLTSWILRLALPLAALVSAVTVSLSLGASAGATTPSGLKLVPGYLRGLPLATRLAPAPAGHAMTIGVELQRPNTQAEQALYAAIYKPGSPEYHHFLTPAAFNRRFGVPAAQISAVHHWLTAGGLTIDTASGDYVVARGTVAQLDRLLRVNIGRYTFKGKGFIANAAPPSVPASLPVAGIAGLDTIHRFALDDLHGRHLARASKALGPQSGNENEFTPQELWGIYNDPGAKSLAKADGTSSPSAVANSSLPLGQGQTIGIFGEGETSSVIAQLRLFEKSMGLPKVPVRVVDTEGGTDSNYGDNSGAIEWYLDSQASTGMAPDISRLDFYFAKTLFDADIFADFDKWANDPNGPREMNASFGECEANPTNPVTGPLAQQPYGTELGNELQAMGDPILRQAAMEGRTLFSSAGDTGSGCPELVAPVIGAGNGVAIQPVPFVGYPCDSQYVTCVGGTVVSADGTSYPDAAKRTAETNWTFSGGGSSHFIAEPAYQQGVANINIPCVSQPDGTPYSGAPPTCRGVPDVADLSGNVTGDGYFIYIDGEPSSEGGTSLSSPLMTGQWARVQSAAAKAVQSRGGLGFANPVIYKQAKDADACSSAGCPSDPVYSRDFFDVTQSEFGAGNGVYQPGPGWDYASGWGALNVANFIHDVDGSDTATLSYPGAEKDAVPVTTWTGTSPAGNATDPVDASQGNDAALDLTKSTLTTSPDGSTVIATLSGPAVGSSPPPDASTGGVTFFVAWQYNGVVYYAQALQSGAGSFTYASGNTGTYGKSSTYGYNNTANTAATGSYDASTHTVTIKVPAKEVGSPTVGSALSDPQAFDQLSTGALSFTTDSSDDLVPVSKDAGRADSIGEDVIVGGAPAPRATSSSSGSFGGARCTRVGGPVVHARARVTPHGITAAGIANNHGCSGRIKSVGVAIARSVGRRCAFLSRKGRFGKLGSCALKPSYFLPARGTTKWHYSRRLRLARGVYLLWAHATNTKHQTTRNTSRKHIFMRLR